MDKFYLFGAGINCEGVIKYFGTENIIGIIDSNRELHGKNISGLNIIDISKYDGRSKIYITSYYRYESIIDMLKKLNIKQYYRSPYMNTGFFENTDDMINKLNSLKMDNISFFEDSPLTENVSEVLFTKYNIKPKIIKNGQHIDANDNLIILDAMSERQLGKVKEFYNLNNIIYVENEYKNKFSYKNENLNKFKNIEYGKRCFIIGNAPSLRYEDLNTLKELGEVCFGVNRIYRAFVNTTWRPKYYVAVDSIICKNDHDIIENIESTKFIRHFFTEVDWKSENVNQFRGISSDNVNFSKNIENGVYIGNTVIYDALQIAYYMGFKKIYLLGVDLDLTKRVNEQGRHFYKEGSEKERLQDANLNYILKAFKYAADVLEKEGVKLRNLSRAGEWDEIKRESFDDVINQIKVEER